MNERMNKRVRECARPQSSHVYDALSFCVDRCLCFSLVLLVAYKCACTINYASDDLQIDYYPFKSTPMHGFSRYSACIYL